MLFSINTHFFDNSYRIDCNFATTAVSLHYYVYEYEKNMTFSDSVDNEEIGTQTYFIIMLIRLKL